MSEKQWNITKRERQLEDQLAKSQKHFKSQILILVEDQNKLLFQIFFNLLNIFI